MVCRKAHLIAAGSVLVLFLSCLYRGDDWELRVVGMAQALIYKSMSTSIPLQAQLGDTFLSSKHQDYLAAIAEFSSAERA